MKKIMKKALSLMLALVMMFSLAPMTAKAATDAGDLHLDGSTVNTVTYTESINWVSDNRYYYTWTPVANGNLNITATTGDLWIQCLDANYQGGELQEPAIGVENSIQVTAGNTYTIWVMTWSETAGTVGFTAEFEEVTGPQITGSGTMNDPYNVTDAMSASGLGYGQTAYYKIAVDNPMKQYTLTVRGGNMADMFAVADAVAGTDAVSAMGGTVSMQVTPATPISSVVFAITNQHFNGGNYTFILEEYVEDDGNTGEGGSGNEDDEYPLGSYFNPVEMEGSDTVTPELGNQYWMVWTPNAAGVVTISTEAGAVIGHESVGGEYEYDYKETENGVSIQVESGDEVLFYVYSDVLTEIGVDIALEAGATLETDDEEIGDAPTFVEMEENAAMSSQTIIIGENTCPLSLYEYTLFEIAPTQTGEYTFTVDNGVIGLASILGMWVDQDLSAISGTTYTWECTDAKENEEDLGQSIWIAVKSNTASEVTITVTREDIEQEGYEKIEWPLLVSPEAYTFEGDEDKLVQFIYSIADDKVAFAMDENGYFHVVPEADLEEDEDALLGYTYVGKKPIEECPLVLVDLSDKTVSLQAAVAERPFLATMYDEEGEVDYIYDFTPALNEYIACADKETGLYPLTIDLLEVFVVGGESAGWYMNTESATGIVAAEFPESDGVDQEALFTFAMYYLNQDVVTLDKEKPVVDKNTMTDIIASNQAGKDTVINTTTKNEAGEEVTIKFEFAAGTMKPVDGKEEYTFEVSLVEKIDDATAEKAEIKKDTFVLGVSFEYDGKLPAKATITIPVPAAYANKTLYYYEVLADGTLKYVCDAPVDANGNAKVTQDHCSDYVLLSEKIVEELPEAPKTGDTTNFALWIAILGLGVVAIAGSVVMKKREF